MHLVVDDQAPVAGVEELQVRVDALPFGRQHLVRGDGDRPDLLPRTAVLADLLLGQRGPLHQLVLPLPGRDRIGHQDQRGRLGLRHRARPDQRLARTAGQHDHTRAAVPEALHGLLLVRPQRPAVLAQLDGVRLTVDVTGQVLGRPAQLEQRLLDLPALRRVHHDRVRVQPRPDQRLHLLRPEDLLQDGAVGGGQHQPVCGVLGEREAPVAGHRLGDVDEQRMRHRIPRELHQRVHDLLGVVPGGPRVPQSQRRHPVRMDVLGRPLQLGKGRDGPLLQASASSWSTSSSSVLSLWTIKQDTHTSVDRIAR